MENVTVDMITEMRAKFSSFLHVFEDRLKNGISDFGDINQSVLVQTADYMVLDITGRSKSEREVFADEFNKDILLLEGSFSLESKKRGKVVYDKDNRYAQVNKDEDMILSVKEGEHARTLTVLRLPE